MLRKLFSLFLIFILSSAYCGAEIIVDDSLHSKIAKKYNLEELPQLPSNLQNSTEESIFTPNEFDAAPSTQYTPPATTTKTNTSQQTKQPTQTVQPQKAVTQTQQTTNIPIQTYDNRSFEAVKLSRWQKFKVTNTKVLSDGLPKGSTIYFKSTIAETNRFITIPQGTVFKGTVLNSHRPNLTGNGGLLVIKITHIIYKGGSYPINASITIANQKNIFFNNIKGNRMYWKNLVKSTNFGKKTYDRMWAKTKKYFKPGIEIILTPITFTTGIIVFGANIIASPILAIFTKGGRLIIPQNAKFEIKLLEDAIIYK